MQSEQITVRIESSSAESTQGIIDVIKDWSFQNGFLGCVLGNQIQMARIRCQKKIQMEMVIPAPSSLEDAAKSFQTWATDNGFTVVSAKAQLQENLFRDKPDAIIYATVTRSRNAKTIEAA